MYIGIFADNLRYLAKKMQILGHIPSGKGFRSAFDSFADQSGSNMAGGMSMKL